MTAYRSSRSTPAQQRFNKVLTKPRIVVEGANGKLKLHWRCILQELEDDGWNTCHMGSTLVC